MTLLARRRAMARGGTYATGYEIPAGYFDGLAAKLRDHAGDSVIEMVQYGDSTDAGQTASGANYSPLRRLRELFTAAGYPDGGHGNLNGINDDAAASGDSESLNRGQGFASSNIYVLPGESGYGDVSGDNETFTRHGRYFTLWYVRFNAGGRFTWELDGDGVEHVVDPVLPTTGGVHTFAKLVIDAGTDATHTIKIRNKGGRLVGAPAYSAGSFAGSGTGGTLATNTYEYAAAFLTTGGAIGALGAVKTVTITLGQTFSFNVPLQVEGGVTTNIYRRVAGVGNYKLIGSVATNPNSAYAFADTGAAAGVDYAASAAPVLESANKWVCVATDAKRDHGIVLHNLSARGSSSGMLSSYNLAVGLGLDLEPPATVAAIDRAVDTSPGARHPDMVWFGHGINDQQGSPSDNSATLKANTKTAIQTCKHFGIRCGVQIPAFETATNSGNAELYRAALKAAAREEGVPWIEKGMYGPLPALTAGSTSGNPHLTPAQYQAQEDYEWDHWWAAAIIPAVALANTVAPAITGSPRTGNTLAASPGTWTGRPSPSYAYQWKRGGTAITGATSSTYVLQVADEGQSITCTVTAINRAGAATATSSAVTGLPAFTIADLAPDLWIDANALTGFSDGDLVASLSERSSNVRALTASGGNRPTYKTNQLNGKPVLRFNGTANMLTLPADILSSAPNTVIFVFKPSAVSGQRIVFTNAKYLAGHSDDNLQYVTKGNTAYNAITGGVSIGTPVVALAALASTYATSFRANTLVGAVAAGGNSANALTGAATIGARFGGGGEYLAGDLAELIVLNRVLTSNEITDTFTLLGAKYGITVA